MIDPQSLPRMAPVTTALLVLYVALALLTDPMDPTREQMLRFGACQGLLVADGEVWRLLTNAFLHFGFVHLGFNAYCLYMFGPHLEAALGPRRFLVLYGAGALGGSLAGCLWHSPTSTLAGGSGALFGMFGAALAMHVRFGRSWTDFLEHGGARQLMVLIAANLLFGFAFPGISNAAHIGGLVAGFVASFCFLARGRHRADATGRWIQAGWLALMASLVSWTMFPFPRADALAWASERAATPEAKAPYERALELSEQIGQSEPGEVELIRALIDRRR